MKKVLYSLFIILAACSSPNSATEENFTKTIQDYLNKEYPSCYFRNTFPTTKTAYNQDQDHDKNILQVLAEIGILSEKEISRRGPSPISGTSISYAYTLTDKGKEYYSPKESAFCFGKAKLTLIDTFSEPAEIGGYKISHVNYSYVVTGFPSWAENKELSLLNKTLKRNLKSTIKPIDKNDVLILTNKGWVHKRLFKK